MEISPNANDGKEVSLKTALIIIIATVVVVIIVGIALGYAFFWNKFDDRPGIERDFERVKQAVVKNPDSPMSYLALGNQLLVRGEHEEALENFKKAYELDNKADLTRFSLGFAYRETGQYEEAIKILEPLVKEKPLYFLAQYNVGVAYHETKQYKKAEEAFLHALQIQGGAADVYVHLARTYKEMGKKDEAIKAVDKALAFVPDYDEALQLKESLK